MCRRRSSLAIALLSVAGALALSGAAHAQQRCRVTDPTGTPLNVRTAPYGRVVGTLPNGALVSVIDRSRDSAGKSWVYVADRRDGAPLGWVYREFISCF